MKLLKKLIIFFSIATIFGFGLFNYYGPRMIIEIDNQIYKTLRKQKLKIPQPSDYQLKTEKISIKTNDGFYLAGYLIRTDSVNQKGTIILVHGIRAYKEHFLPVCKMLADNGFNSVIIDLRAHGESEGKYCSFGFKEKYDLVILMDSLCKIESISKNFGIWGQSLGASVALQTMAIEKRIKFGIIESAFSDFRTIVNDYAKNTIGFSWPILNDYLIWRSENIADFNANDVKPYESAKQITQPVLMVHGKLDKRIKIEYGLQNFNNLSSIDKEFIEISNGTHLNIWQISGNEYFNKVLGFLNRVKN